MKSESSWSFRLAALSTLALSSSSSAAFDLALTPSRSAANNEVARDAKRQRPSYSTPSQLRAVRRACGDRCPGWLPDDRLCTAGASAAEFRAPDRTTLRYLPHRLSCADPLRPKVQAARLYDGWRPLPHHAVFIQHRK